VRRRRPIADFAPMSECLSSVRISRRSVLRLGAAATALAASGLPLPSLATTGGPANVRVSDDRYGVHVEPFVALNPRDLRNLLAVCQVSPTAAPQFIASYVSFDGGATWQSGGVPSLPADTLGSADVTVAFDALGRGYVCATGYTAGGRNDRRVYVWRTDDGGRSFTAPVAAMAGQFDDHPWLAADRWNGPSAGNLYVVWAAADGTALGFTRSTDGGGSFEPPRLLQGATRQAGIPVVAAGPRGLVCAVYDGLLPASGSSGDVVAQVEVVCSTDAGQTFAAPVPLGLGTEAIDLAGNVQPNGCPTVAAAPRGDAVYAAFTTHQPGADHSDIVVAASYDRGRTWLPAVPATPADHVIYFQPQLAVDEAGRVAVSAFALADGLVDVVLLVSGPRELRFGPPFRVTSSPFDPTRGTVGGGKHGAWWIGDYQGLAASPCGFQALWNDTRTGRLDLFTATVQG
jgi:hypothetical protein